MSKSQIIIPIAVSAIGGLLIFIGTTAYNDVFKQPKVDINSTPMINQNHNFKWHNMVEVKNTGISDARNLRLTLSSYSNITNATSSPSIENITDITNSSKGEHWRQMLVPRLAPNADLKIDVEFAPPIKNPSKNNNTLFQIYATYDGHSTIASYYLNNANLMIWQQKHYYPEIQEPFIYSIIGIGAMVALILYLSFRRKRILRKAQLRRKICHDMQLVINAFEDDQKLKDDVLLSDKLYSLHIWRKETVDARYEFVGAQNYGAIDEFFHRVSIHDEIIRQMYQQFKTQEFIQTTICPINQALKCKAQHIIGKGTL